MCFFKWSNFLFYLNLIIKIYIVLAERKQFFIDILNAHNEYRRIHGVPDLVLNDEVSNNIFLLLFV